jgi:hypothetical protein
MANNFYLKRGDTGPAIRFALIPEDLSLAGATVRFQMRARAGMPVIDAPALIVAQSGPAIVEYSWQPGDSLAAGFYEAEFRVVYADGKVETFPNVGFISVQIAEDVPSAAMTAPPAAFAAGQCVLTGNNDVARVYQTLTTVAGALYQIEADIDSTTNTGVDFVAGGVTLRTVEGIVARVLHASFVAAGTSTVVGLEIPASRTSTATVNALSCYPATRIDTLAEVVTFAGVTRGSLTSGDLDSAALAAIDTAAGYAIGWAAVCG